MAKVYATGKRKTAVDKVWVSAPGKGTITVNGIDFEVWLGGHETIKKRVRQPLALTKQEASFDIVADTLGGGYSAQFTQRLCRARWLRLRVHRPDHESG